MRLLPRIVGVEPLSGLGLLGVLLATVLFPLSCGDGLSVPINPCTGPISLQAGKGQNARFDWTPRCGLVGINLVPPPSAGGPSEGWTVISETALIPPGIRHGEAPPGTRLVVPAFQVTPGNDYAVFFTAQSGQPPIAAISWIP
jgi:hypothetical protein